MKVAGTSLTAVLLLSFAATVVTVHSGSSNGVDVASGPQLGAWIETMSWKPRAFVYHGFLSEQECDHIIALATPLMQRSSVVHHNGSTDPQDDIRTSYGTFLRPAIDDIIRRIELRIGAWTHLPPENAESMQVLRYEDGQKYGGHWDELDPSEGNRTVGGPGISFRVATVLMYLTDVEEGGETAFPQSRWLNKEIQTAGKQYSKCTNGGVAVKPKKGDALLFWGLKMDLKHLEAFSFHTGCPVIKGTKWSATKWIHTSSFGFQNVYRAQGSKRAAAGNADMKIAAEYQYQNQNQQRPCKDIEDSCSLWAKAGHCKTRFAYMVGTLDSPGRCRKSCGMCCPPADVLCDRRVNGFIRRASQSIA